MKRGNSDVDDESKSPKSPRVEHSEIVTVIVNTKDSVTTTNSPIVNVDLANAVHHVELTVQSASDAVVEAVSASDTVVEAESASV